MNELRVEALPYDEEDVLNILISASSFGYSGRVEIYVRPTTLSEFGIDLLNFPVDIHHKVQFEIGNNTGEWAYHLILRAQVIDNVGHSVLFVHMQSFVGVLENALAEFYILSEAASINALGKK
jgi:hypothetical protein